MTGIQNADCICKRWYNQSLSLRRIDGTSSGWMGGPEDPRPGLGVYGCQAIHCHRHNQSNVLHGFAKVMPLSTYYIITFKRTALERCLRPLCLKTATRTLDTLRAPA